jgi:aspartate carbamoyltransferase regulatory subunit
VKKLEVSGIKDGTVIDHLPPQKVFFIARILELDKSTEKVFIGINLESSKHGKKGLIKIANKTLSAKQTYKLSLVAPEATVNIIKDYEVVEKRPLKLPKTVEGIIACTNPACITNHEPVKTRFLVTSEKPVTLRCHYCERGMGAEDIKT